MKVTKFKRNPTTGKLEEYIIEEDSDFVFSTHTNVLVEKLKKKKNENSKTIRKIF